MNYKLTALFLMAFSFAVGAQGVPPNPVPGCLGPQSVGMMQPTGISSQYFIGAYSTTGQGDCAGIQGHIVHGDLLVNEYAYVMFDADHIIESTIGSVDFSIDLSTVLVNLPIGEQVRIVELYSDSSRIAGLTLKKIPNRMSSSRGARGQNYDPYRWQLTVKWYGGLSGIFTEDKFNYAINDVIEYNYVAGLNNQQYSAAAIFLNGDLTVNPYDGLSDPESSYGSSELVTYFVGFIETSATLIEGDRINFDINWDVSSDPVTE